MIDKKLLFVTLIIVFLIGLAYFLFESKNEKFCLEDNDCSCGVKITTGECFVGNKKYVNEKVQCPDYCTGIGGNFMVKCINNECKLVQKDYQR